MTTKLKIPYGWRLEPYAPPDLDVLVLVTHGPRYATTIDFRDRCFRSGFSTSGPPVGEAWSAIGGWRRYDGRGWRQKIVDDAVAHLRGVLRS